MKQYQDPETAMDTTRSDRKRADRTTAVSESIGAILLVSIVALFVAIVGVSLFSMQAPTKVPNLNFMAGTNDAKTILYLYHNGGDSLNVGEFSVLVDGVPKAYTVSGGGSQWSLGKNLIVPITTMPANVQIVYNGTAGVGGTGGALLLRSGSVNLTKSVNITEDRMPYLDCAAVKNWDCADQIPPEIIIAEYQKNITTKRVMFSQSWQARGIIVGGSSPTYHFNFTVVKANSSIHIADPSNPNCNGGTVYQLPVGTKVGILLTSNPEFLTIYGMAPQIWELTAGTASRITTVLTFTNNTVITKAGQTVCQGYISEYSDLDSTLRVRTQVTDRTTSLIINDTVIFDGSTSSRVFDLQGVQPIDNGLFLVTYGAANTPVYVIGWPTNISWT